MGRSKFPAGIPFPTKKGVTDPIAIRAKAIENLVFAVSQLTEAEQRKMGYSKQEFITKCSFNGRECSVEELAAHYYLNCKLLCSDFSLYVDPTFGNCFTFNAYSASNVRSERAGPNYGEFLSQMGFSLLKAFVSKSS